MYIFLCALDGSLALITHRSFPFFKHLAGFGNVRVNLAAQLFSLAACSFLGVLEQALGITDESMKFLNQCVLCGLQVTTVGGRID